MVPRTNKLGWWLMMLPWVGGATLLLWVLVSDAARMRADVAGPLVAVLMIAGLMVLFALYLIAGWRGAVRTERVEQGMCVECGHDLRASWERCPECGTTIPIRPGEAFVVPLRDEWPEEPIAARAPSPGEGKVRVYTGAEGMEQDLLVQQLRARGVACFITRRKAGGFWLHWPAPWVEDVHVWSVDEADARRIIERMVDADGRPRRERVRDASGQPWPDRSDIIG